MNPKETITFHKSIIVSHQDGNQTEFANEIGQIRYNHSSHQFEGYYDKDGADHTGNQWRPFHQNIASSTSLGIIKIGNNLTIDNAGILSSIIGNNSKQNIITISPISGAADFISIHSALTYISTNCMNSANPIIMQLSTGIHYLTHDITLDNIHIIGYGSISATNIIGNYHIVTASNCTISNLKLTDITLNSTNLNCNMITCDHIIMNSANAAEFQNSHILNSNIHIKCPATNPVIFDNMIITKSNIYMMNCDIVNIRLCRILATTFHNHKSKCNILYSYFDKLSKIQLHSNVSDITHGYWSSIQHLNTTFTQHNIIGDNSTLYHITYNDENNNNNGLYYISDISTSSAECLKYKSNNKLHITTSDNITICELYIVNIKYSSIDCTIDYIINNTTNFVDNDNIAKYIIFSTYNDYSYTACIGKSLLYIDTISNIYTIGIQHHNLSELLTNIKQCNQQQNITIQLCANIINCGDYLQIAKYTGIQLDGIMHNCSIVTNTVEIVNCKEITICNIIFTDIEQGIIVRNSQNIIFNKCRFNGNQLIKLFKIEDCEKIIFKNCEFSISANIDGASNAVMNICKSNRILFSDCKFNGICENGNSIFHIWNDSYTKFIDCEFAITSDAGICWFKLGDYYANPMSNAEIIDSIFKGDSVISNITDDSIVSVK